MDRIFRITLTLKHPQLFKTGSKVILETRGPCPGALESYSYWEVGDTDSGNLARTRIALPPGRVHIPLQRGWAARGTDRQRLGKVGSPGPHSGPDGPQCPRSPRASRAASPSAAPNARPPTWGRWAARGLLPAPARPAGRCRQHRGAEATAPADRRRPAPESLALRFFFFLSWWSLGLCPPPAAGPRSPETQPRDSGCTVGLSFAGHPKEVKLLWSLLLQPL